MSRAHDQFRAKHRGKAAHLARVAAQEHADRLNDLGPADPVRGELMVYLCAWSDDYREGETADFHWHVGHERPPDSAGSRGVHSGDTERAKGSEPR